MSQRLFAAAQGGGSVIGAGDRGAICIYVDGVPQFVDELELLSDARQDYVLDIYCDVLGLNQICIGPTYALQYDHHDRPPIDWRFQDPIPLLRKLRTRGLHITLAFMPDCWPFYNGRDAWDFGAFESLVPIYQAIADRGLADSIRLEWEVLATNTSYCIAARTARGIFGPTIPIYYHNPVGHLSPGLSSEDEQACWRAFLAAGGSGLDLQCGPPYSRPDALQAMKFDAWDMTRRAHGIDGSPWGGPLLTLDGVPMTVRNAEYAAGDIYHNGLPWATAQQFGREGETVHYITTALDGI